MTVSKPLGVGLIGCGGFGRFVLAAVADVPAVDVRAITDGWRCRRRLIADALVFEGLAIRELIDKRPGVVHEISAASAVMMGTMCTRRSPDGAEQGQYVLHALAGGDRHEQASSQTHDDGWKR